VPHHPGASGEIEKAVPGPEGALDIVLFFVLDKSADGAMYNAFGFTGCAGGI